MKRRLNRTGGFSLLELLAVITIIGILASVILARVSTQAFEAKKKSCLRYKRDLNVATEHYYLDQGSYPSNFSDLCTEYYPVVPRCPVTNLPYEIDGVTHCVQGHNH